MKILMFSDSYGSVTTTFIRNEVLYMHAKYDLVYVAGNILDNKGGVKIVQLPFKENILSRKRRWIKWTKDKECDFKNKSYAKKINEIIDQEKPDIIHCHFAYEALKLLQNIDESLSIPVFVHFHGYGASQMLRKKSYVKAIAEGLNKPNIYPICVSDYMLTYLKVFGVIKKDAPILRYGIDLDKFKPSGSHVEANSSLKQFLQVSSLVEKKGHVYAIEAIELFLKEFPEYKDKVIFKFTGDGENIMSLNKLCVDKGISDQVKFIGNVSSETARDLMDASHYYIHHSVESSSGDKEGIPNSIMEAMAMKLPVLSTFHAGIPELVEHNVNGLLCEERDVDTFAKQIKEILEWEKLDRNREKVDDLYNFQKHNIQLEKLYLEKIG